MIIDYNGRTLDISFDHLNAGLRVWVFEWHAPAREWVKLSDDLHILVTEFEALCNLGAELFGESVEGEELARLLGVEMRSSDDAKCEKCGAWDHYEEMVHGTDALPEIAERLEIGNWDYVCMNCYTTELQTVNA